MEKSNTLKQTSVPSISTFNQKNYAASNHASVTHPSARSKDYFDTIFKKINSGDNILSRFPTRLDPNIEFSDDEEEDDRPPKNKKTPDNASSLNKSREKENKVMRTPELPPISRSLFNSALGTQDRYLRETDRKYESKFSSASRVSVNANYRMTVNVKEPQNLFLKSKNMPLHPVLKPSLSEKSIDRNYPKKDVFGKVMQCSSIGPAKPNFHSLVDPAPKPKTFVESSYVPDSIINDSKGLSLSNDVIQVNGRIYNVLSLLGSGGSCKVYSVYDTENKSRVAIKRVNFSNTDALICEGYKQEIEYLRKLQNSDRVIKIFDFEYRENELLLVLEHGDIDFAKYISNQAKLKCLKPLTIKFYWSQMLEAVADIHKYGIVHSDLKPANFLLVNGHLKLIDFGIATSVPEDKTSTFRDTQVGTINYMSPEAITQMSGDVKSPLFKVGVKSDVWSLGCILYNLVYGVTPFHNIKVTIQKIYAITNPNYEIPFKTLSDPLLLDVLKSCLKRDPKERASVEELLKHPYLAKDNESPANAMSVKPNADFNNILAQMQNLTPRRMQYVTKVVQELADKANP